MGYHTGILYYDFAISFRVYHNVSICTIPGIHPSEERSICYSYSTDLSSVTPGKIHIKGACVT